MRPGASQVHPGRSALPSPPSYHLVLILFWLSRLSVVFNRKRRGKHISSVFQSLFSERRAETVGQTGFLLPKFVVWASQQCLSTLCILLLSVLPSFCCVLDEWLTSSPFFWADPCSWGWGAPHLAEVPALLLRTSSQSLPAKTFHSGNIDTYQCRDVKYTDCTVHPMPITSSDSYQPWSTHSRICSFPHHTEAFWSKPQTLPFHLKILLYILLPSNYYFHTRNDF
jgi:hypothetical protein